MKVRGYAFTFGFVAALLTAGIFLGEQGSRDSANWADYGGDAESTQYSALRQIDKSNVAGLTQAWFYPVPGTIARFNFNPLIVAGVMYLEGQGGAVTALDAATGRILWQHPVQGTLMDRGFNYWQSKDGSDRRIIFSADSYLQEVDAQSGRSIASFGAGGRVNLRLGLGRDLKTIPQIQTGTPGRVFEDSIILGSATSEAYGSPPGDLRAFDVRTGKLRWTFHTIPHPGEFGYDTWPKDAWKYVGGVNTWGEISIDWKRGIGYFPLGSPTYDYWGGDRIGADLFGDCLLALNLRTGKRLWYFQTVHHDLWDYDPTTGPKLLTIEHGGRRVDVVAQATKSGFVFVFNRVTGQPIWPIHEKRVLKSDAPGERSWPTQPFPTAPRPFARQSFTADEIDPYMDQADKEKVLAILRTANNHGIFTPGTADRDSIQIPGDVGGANWGSSAADPQTGVMYIRTSDVPELKLRLSPRQPLHIPYQANMETQGHAIFAQMCQGCHGPNRVGVRSPRDIGVAKFEQIVTTGEGEMPAFTDLPAHDLDALAAFISNPGASGPVRAGGAGGGMERIPALPGITRYFGVYENRILASNGLPAVRPPWTSLVAVDLNQGTIKWSVPLGTAPGLAARGIANTGAVNVLLAAVRNGPVVTAGGIVFVGSWGDRTLHAFDKDSGKLLWQQEIGANPEGIPSIYEAGGREYVVFCAAAHPASSAPGEGYSWSAGKPQAQGYYAFALPLPQAR
ncbi:MAG: PQQ-binding-like beta-propeller repeat protein [Acidobacteriota bacterium]